VDFYRKAVALSPKLYPAYAGMGMNLMRVGDLKTGRAMLERAFAGDPYNVWAYNTLDLLDQMDTFTTGQSEHCIFRMAKEDQPVLLPMHPSSPRKRTRSWPRGMDSPPGPPAV